MSRSGAIRRGELWWVDLGWPIGHEASSQRPALILSDDRFNEHALVSVVPLTRSQRDYPTRVELEPGTSGLEEVSYVQCEQVRTISSERLVRRLGVIEPVAMVEVERTLRRIFRL